MGKVWNRVRTEVWARIWAKVMARVWNMVWAKVWAQGMEGCGDGKGTVVAKGKGAVKAKVRPR